jgi:uncharacterized membrane protein YhaH (DUF805 family)
MDLQSAVTVCLVEKYATFRGRASRTEFWWFAVFCSGIALLGLLANPTVGFIIIAGLVAPCLAVCVRRFHDLNSSGWWILIGLVPTIGILALAAIMCAPGTVGANRFGTSSDEGSQRKDHSGTSHKNEWSRSYREKTEDRAQAPPEHKADSESWHHVLQVSPNASNEVIKAAYKTLMAKYHPDKVAHLGEEIKAVAEKRAKEINQAYETAKQERGM